MLPEGPVANLMLLAGMALLAVILLRRIYRRTRRKKKANRSGAAERKVSSPLIDAPPELTRWQVEMHEVARELRAEIDTKAVMVQTLIGMLREEIDRLESVVGNSPAAVPALDPDVLAEIKQLSSAMTSEADRSQAKADNAIEQLDQAMEDEPPSAADRVHELAQQGMLADEIAELVGMKARHVEFILASKSRAD